MNGGDAIVPLSLRLWEIEFILVWDYGESNLADTYRILLSLRLR